MLMANCPSPFAVQFSSGIISTALGTTPGASGTAYNIQLSGFIPTAGSQLVYINASYFNLGQTQETVVGPPQGNPAFNPNFAPFNFYTEAVDSIAILASLTPPDNINTFALVETMLTAGMTGIPLTDLSYATQVLSSRVLGVQSVAVSINTTLTQANAGITQNCSVSGTTISLPDATVSVGYPFIFHGDAALGSGYVTILPYGTDTIQTGGPESYYTSVSLTAGMTIAIASNGSSSWLTSAQANNVPISWNASGAPPNPLSISTSGGVQTPYSITASGATNPNQLVTLAQLQGLYTNMQVFTTSSTFTVPSGVTKIKARGVAGGGGGGGYTTDGYSCGGAGGAGGYFEGVYSVTPGQAIPITIGGYGAGGANGSYNGDPGGTTSFGAFATATGGIGGTAGDDQAAAGGPGGASTGGMINISGGYGTDGLTYATTQYSVPGIGGSCPLGGGGRAGDAAGQPGGGYGSGGGGAYAGTGPGGNGAPGTVILEW